MKKLLLPVVLFAIAGAMNPSYAATEDYVAGFMGDIQSFCADETPAGVNIGGACFSFNGSKSTATISVSDLAVDGVGFWIGEYKADGSCVTPDPDTGLCSLTFGGCGNKTYSLDPSTREIVIALDGPIFGPLDCPDSGGFATAGTITATFS